MANAIQQAGGASEPSSFAPLHTNRMFTGLWTNRNPLSDASVSTNMEKYGLGLQDSIIDGLNTELSSQLTLRRRRGTSVYNTQTFPPINRFYPFNTFTLTSELIRVMADTAATVYDATGPSTQTPIWTKSPGAGPTFFLGLGNTLYFTNGVDNKQWNYTLNQVWNWGIAAPTTAPIATQAPRPNPPPSRQPDTAYETHNAYRNGMILFDTNGNSQVFAGTGVTGAAQPTWNPTTGGTTTDGTVTWTNGGNASWLSNHAYAVGSIVIGESLPSDVFSTFVVMTAGTSGATRPNWITGVGLQVSDGTVTWVNIGPMMLWASIGPGITITSVTQILDSNGNLQNVQQSGVTAASGTVTWGTELGSFTTDGSMIWVNAGPWAVANTAITQWGYAYVNSVGDISEMSPASTPLTVLLGNQVTLQGAGSSDPQVTQIYIYRYAQGGSTFIFDAKIPNPGAGQTWTFVDNTPDSGLNPLIQAQVNGEGTPLPAGATCMAYHLQRFFVAVGNVTYVSSGPDAIASTSSGNAGFNTTFTCQSKIIRYWVSPLGLIIITVRDSYIILGTGTADDPLYQTTFIDGLPLLHYDAFTTHLTTPYMLLGTNVLVALDPSAGITEVGFPIADKLETEFTASTAYVTYHAQASKENALYVDDGVGSWYRMSATTAPETGLNWSPKATLSTPSSAVQSVEILPGTNRLLIGPGPAGGPIRMRDLTTNTDLGVPFTAHATFGSIVLAHPGELAALAFVTLEAKKIGSRAALSVLLGEIYGTPAAPFETLGRTRQDPTNLPPSNTLYSDRYHFMQSQNPAWCRHFQMDIAWPAEDAANELLTFTIFGQTWSEYRSQ
jgi:hypothetical protein